MKKTINKKENFTSIHNKLINDSKISLKAKGIMLYMLSKPENWKYNPKEIAKNSKDGLDSVYSGIKELMESGYISRIRHSDGTVDYFVFEDAEENDIIDFSKKENPNRENPNRENPNRENPDVYKRKNTNNKRIIVIKEYIYKGEKFLEIYSDFKNMRKNIKKPMTERAEKILLTKLKKLTGENNEELAIKILEQSILNNWQDIYPLKEENNANGSNGYKKSYQSKNDKHNQKTDRTNDGKNWN